MKVVGVHEYGGPDQLGVIVRPEPHAGSGQVRIRTEYAGVNPVDAMVRRGDLAAWFGDVPPPFVPGMDIVGVVDEVSPDVSTSVAIGDRVIAVVGNFGDYGAYSQFVVVPAASAVAPPIDAAGAEAGSFLMNALTARSVVDAAGPGPRVLVTGAAGAVGANCVALAAHDGLDVTALAPSSDSDFLKRHGATHVVSSIEELDDGYDVVMDTAGIAEAIIDRVADAGTVVVVQPKIPKFGRGITVTHVSVRDRVADAPALRALVRLAESETLPLRVAGVFPAEQAAAAHRKLDERGTRGRFVLDFTHLT